MAGQGLTFGEVDCRDADGARLAHSLTIAGGRWAKGRVLDAADIAAALSAGYATLTVARLDPGDVAEDAAATALAAALAGSGVTTAAAAHGRANLIARTAGVLHFDPAGVEAVNAIDEGVTLGTLLPHTRVAAGEVVATVKIIPYAVTGRALAATVAAAPRLAVAAFAAARYVLIQTRLAGTPPKLLDKTDAVTRARIAGLGATLAPGWIGAPHSVAGLAVALAAQPGDATILIAGASATADRRDVIPAAIVAAGGRIERLGMPVDPGNLLCLGTLTGRAVIGLPGCARSPKRNGFDWVLERLAAGLAVGSGEIAAMGVGGLLPEAERPQPRATRGTAIRSVGAIVLAAGRSTRMGAANKLLADLDGKPVVAHVVDAIAAAGLPPPVVVTGHMGEQVRAALGKRAAIFVEATAFAAGMAHSLAAGIGAVPPGWSAMIVCLGDMPRVGPGILAALAAAAATERVVAVPIWAGKRGNPVLWGRAHFRQLAALAGDVGGKALLADLADSIIEVAADDDGVLADVDTPEALAAMREE